MTAGLTWHPGDRPYRVGQRQQHQTEGQGDAEGAHGLDAADGRAHRDEHQERGADELRGDGTGESGRHRGPPDRPQPHPTCSAQRLRTRPRPGAPPPGTFRTDGWLSRPGP